MGEKVRRKKLCPEAGGTLIRADRTETEDQTRGFRRAGGALLPGAVLEIAEDELILRVFVTGLSALREDRVPAARGLT